MRVSYPILDLAYANQSLLICGGGGSAKTGINNYVDVYELGDISKGEQLFLKTIELETEDELVFGVDISPDGLLVAASVKSSCWVFEMNKKDKSLELLVKFRSDFAEYESEQSIVKFVGNGTLVTGGSDGIVRVWKLEQGVNDVMGDDGKRKQTSMSLDCIVAPSGMPIETPQIGDQAFLNATQVTLQFEYKGHNKRIKQIDVDPFSRNMIASSAEDQTCHLWRLSEQCKTTALSILDGFDFCPEKKSEKIPPRLQFRCVKFASDGRSLFTILSPPRGWSYLVKWEPVHAYQYNAEEWKWLPTTAIEIINEPVGSLAISPSNTLAAIGSSSGIIHVYTTKPEKHVKDYLKHYHTCRPHSFAITGLTFVESEITKELYLVSAGADKELGGHLIPAALPKGFLRSCYETVVSLECLLSSTVFGIIFGFLMWISLIIGFHIHYGKFDHLPDKFLQDIKLNDFHVFFTSDYEEILQYFIVALISVLFYIGVTFHWSSTVVHGLAIHTSLNGLVCLFNMIHLALFQSQMRWKLTSMASNESISSDLTGYVLVVSAGALSLFLFVCFYVFKTYEIIVYGSKKN